MRTWGLLGCLFVAGCDPSPDLEARQICDAVCTCDSPSPAQQESCVEECVVELAGIDFDDACVECATSSACLAIDDCFDLCFPGVP
jgi:hypothetical protein